MADERRSPWIRIPLLILKLLWNAFVVSIPLLSFWIASSLATYLNGPFWLPIVAGVAAFPLLPLLWEGISAYRFNKKVTRAQEDDREAPERILKFSDRFILRTLVVNIAFLAAIFSWFPQDTFTALSTRGDWMLEQQEGEWVEPTRQTLFQMASALEILYSATRDNPFEKYADDDDDTPDPTPTPDPDDDSGETDGETDGSDDDSTPHWPPPDQLHPAIQSIPESAETDIESLANYIESEEDDPHRQMKAIYDWVADNIRYDAKALAAGRYPPQDAPTVFEKRIGVCAGYANLVEAIGEKLGFKVVYVSGVSRDQQGDVSGDGHAWNAVRIEGDWYLLDATWGAGHVDGTEFEKEYDSTYLFTPPEILGLTHFPDNSSWQLRSDPITRGAFMRQPMLKPSFHSRGLELVQPTRSQVSIDGDALLRIQGTSSDNVMAKIASKDGTSGTRCDIGGRDTVEVTCPVDKAGSYIVTLFGDVEGTNRYSSMGRLEFNR